MLRLDAEPITGPGGCRGWGRGASRGQGTIPGHGGCGAGLLRWALCSPVASAGWLAGWHPVLVGTRHPVGTAPMGLSLYLRCVQEEWGHPALPIA